VWIPRSWTAQSPNIRGWQEPIEEDEGPAPLEITFPESIVYPIDVFHLGRGLVGNSISRAYFGLTQDGVNYAVDFDHGQTADCTAWNSSLSGYDRASASLTAGAKTGAEVAAAAQTALEGLGVTGITRDGDTLSIEGASDFIAGASMTDDESRRGMWGRQRVDFGSAGVTAPSYTAVNATVAAHITTPATAGRVLGVYILSSNGARTGSLRMGYAAGPAYSTAPGAFSAGQEGLVTRNGDVAILLFPQPIAMPASSDRWIFWKTNTAAAWGVETRLHTATPPGRGDLTVNERVIVDLTQVNPAVNIFTAGAYTMTASTTGQAYGAVGLIYELPTDGDYYGDGGVETWNGFHGAYNANVDGAGVSTTGPTILDGLADTVRFGIPWDCQVTELRQAANAGDAYPADPAPTLLLGLGPINASTGAGYKTFQLETPLELSGVTRLALFSTAGNRDGSIPATTITICFTPRAGAGATNAWLNGWIDDGRTWDDFVPERGGLGINQQYLTVPGGMPFGDPDPDYPETFVVDATDTTAENHPRVAVKLRRRGIRSS
jgi:hypothetical protein